MDTTIAFRAYAVGNDFAKTPACLVLTITDALRQQVLDAVTAIRQFGFVQVVIDDWFLAPEVCSEELEEILDERDYVAVEHDAFNEVDEQRVESMALVVDGDCLWLRCVDHYSDWYIESAAVPIAGVLGAVPVAPDTSLFQVVA